MVAAPANDDIANAQALTSGTQVLGTNVDATVQTGEKRGSTVTTSGPSVWYRWVCPAPAPGSAQFSTVGSNFDTYLAVFRKSVANPTAFNELIFVAEDDDAGGSGTSLLSFTPTAGVSYYIQVAGFGSSDTGSIVLNYPTPGPSTSPNDNVANAVTLQNGTTSTGLVENSAATAESGELTGSDDTTTTVSAAGHRTLWWRWKAPANGSTTITTLGSVQSDLTTQLDTYLTVFKAKSGVSDPVTAVTGLDIVASDDDESGTVFTSSVTFTAVASTIYYLQVRTFSTATTDFGYYKLNYPSPAADSSATTANAGQAAVSVAGHNPTAVTVVPLSSVQDTFDDNTVGPIWSGDYGTGVGESGGKATITADTGYNAKQTAYIYTMDSVFSQVGAPNAGTSTDAAMDWGVRSGAQSVGTDIVFYLDVVNGQLYAASRVGYSDGTPTQVAYDSTSHAWWRIRRTGGNVLWDVSADGSSWSNLRTAAEPAWLAANPSDVGFHSETHRVDGAGTGATLDNFNVAGAAATTAAAGTASATVDAHNPSAQTTVTAAAGAGAVAAAGHNPAAATSVTATAGAATVSAAGFSAAAAVTFTAAAGSAAVAADGHNPAAVTVPEVTAAAGQADVTAAGHSPGADVVQPAGLAAVTADVFTPAVSTSSNVTTPAGAADVVAEAFTAATVLAATATAGTAEVTAAGHNPAAATTAEGVAAAGVADVTATAHTAAGQPVQTVTAGLAEVTADAANPAVSTATETTATAGAATVAADAPNPTVITAVIVAAGAATVTADGLTAVADTAAAAAPDALDALAAAQAFNALVVIGVNAGAAVVEATALSVPKQRQPGTLTAGSRRSRLSAGTLRGPTYTNGG